MAATYMRVKSEALFFFFFLFFLFLKNIVTVGAGFDSV